MSDNLNIPDNQFVGQCSQNNNSYVPNNPCGQNIYVVEQPVKEERGMSIASMVLGIAGFVTWCVPIAGYPITIIGLVMGIKGMKKGGRGMAGAGIVMCSITLYLTLIKSVVDAFESVLKLG